MHIWTGFKISLALGLGVFPFQIRAGEMAREFRSAEHLGMGDTGVTSADGADAIFYNPANIARSKGILNEIVILSPQVSVGDDTRLLVKDIRANKEAMSTALDHKGKPQHISIQNLTSLVFKKSAVGLLQSVQTDVFVGDDIKTGLPYAELQAVARVGAYTSFAQSFASDSLFLGGTLKYIQKAESNLNYSVFDAQKLQSPGASDFLTRGWGVGADVGGLWRMGGDSNPSLGATLKNIGGVSYRPMSSSYTKNVSKELQSLDVGFSVEPATKKSKTLFAVDLRDALNASHETIYKRIHLGAEVSFSDILGFHGGLNQGYKTAGVFLNLKIIRLDAGLYSEELGKLPGDRQSKRYFARASVGWTK